MERRLFVFVNLFHARHVRKNYGLDSTEDRIFFRFAKLEEARAVWLVESKTWANPRRDGTGRRTAGRRGRAETGSTARRQWDSSPRRNKLSYPPDDGRMTSWVFLWKQEQGKPYLNLSNRKNGHTTGRSGRGAQRSGQAGSGKIACQWNYSPRKQKSTVSSKKRENAAPTLLQNDEKAKTYVNRQGNKITGWPAIYDRFITGLSAGRVAFFVPGCRPVERSLFVFVNPFDARHVREPLKEQKPH